MTKNFYKSAKFKVYLDAEKAWEVIEYKAMGYNRNIDELYPDAFQTETISKGYNNTITEILVPGEKYDLLQDQWFGYAITSYGRLISLRHNKMLGVYVKTKDITTDLRNKKVKFSEEFKKRGWNFNIQNIINNYKTYEWPNTKQQKLPNF